MSRKSICILALFGAAAVAVHVYTSRRATEKSAEKMRQPSAQASDKSGLSGQAAPAHTQPPHPASNSTARTPAISTEALFSRPEERAAWVTTQSALATSQKEKAIVEAQRRGIPVRGERDGRAFELAAWIKGRPYVRTTCNKNAAISTATDRVRQTPPHFLDGHGTVIGLWDAGSARLTHQEYVSRSLTKDGASPHSHSTHVAGSLVAQGIRATAKGMAPDASLDSYDWNNDYGEMASRAKAAPNETNNIPISNHSYGFQAGWFGTTWFGTWGLPEADGFGQYDTFAALADQVCYNAPYFLPFKASGNDRNDGAPSTGVIITYFDNGDTLTKPYNPATDPPSDNWDQGGFDTIAHDANAKNIMTVGAVNDAVSGTNRNVAAASMPSFSSWGPTDDGRVKPDIVANGVNLESTSSSSDTSYATLSGTSMATPNAAGSAVLIAEHFAESFPGQAIRNSMLKGLIIHTATDLGRPGPDYTFGWGLMDTQAAVQHIDAHASRTSAARMVQGQINTVTQTNKITFLWNKQDPIKVTLCWTDPAGAARTGFDDRSPTLKHDLDLRLLAPGNTVYEPYVLDVEQPSLDASHGDNDVDNVEQIRLDAPSKSGTYTVLVSIEGPLTRPSQDYALLISGVGLRPDITHTPLQNTTNTVTPYVVEADIQAEAGLDEESVTLVWWPTDGEIGLQILTMDHVTNDTFRAEILPQPLGTVINYLIFASDVNGLTRTIPDTGPSSTFTFSVVTALPLTVAGFPAPIGLVDPVYGTVYYPSGVTVTASANLYTPPSNDVRSICVGWNGFGNLPALGEGREVSFDLDEESGITWLWEPAYRLTQSSSPQGFLDSTSWWRAHTTAVTVEASAHIVVAETNYAFVGWTINGARQPNAIGAADNPITGIVMTTPKTTIAHYVDEALDADLDLLPDWWESFYAGSNAMIANVDDDNDGFSNRSEYEDGTNPVDPLSRPTPPAIAHVPLANPQRTPAAWPVTAHVTDSAGVQGVMLEWRRNSGLWQQQTMTAVSNDDYYAEIPMPGVSGDTFSYYIRAADRSGLQSINGTYTFSVAYPIMSLSTNDFGILRMSAGAATIRVLSVHNLGHDDLQWTADLVSHGLNEDVENGPGNWTHAGANDAWHISKLRSYSGSNSWYFGNEGTRLYPDNAKASLTSPLIYVPQQSAFSFMQWLETEELQDPQHAWDGAIVEISTNAGTSFDQITPIGGYPYRIFGHPASAFPDETPCFAGTGGWERVTFNLSAYTGTFVQFRLTFGSDGFVTEEGWYVDDFEVGPFGGQDSWLNMSITNATVSSQGSRNVLLSIDTQDFDYGEVRQSVIRLTSNDPISPEQFVYLGATNVSRVIAVVVTGPGSVTPPGPVVADVGDTVDFLIEADTYHHIASITAGENVYELSFNLPTTNVMWSVMNSSATGHLYVVFAANLVTNGLTELWLAGHGLTNAPFADEALLDRDGDGANALHEFVAGTDPTNRANVLALLLQDVNAGSNAVPSQSILGLRLAWPSAAQRTYSLYSATDMHSGFNLLVSNIVATPPSNVYTSSAPLLSNQLFRIEARFGE